MKMGLDLCRAMMSCTDLPPMGLKEGLQVRDKSSSPYKLRDTSKLPSRYRDEEVEVPPIRVRTPAKTRTPTKNTPCV